MLYELDVAPPMATPSFFHWYVNGPVPLAVLDICSRVCDPTYP